MQSVQQRCADENIFVNAYKRFHGHIRVRTLLRICVCICRHARKRGQCRHVCNRTSTRRKLILSGTREHYTALSCWTLVNRYVFNCRHQSSANKDGISGGSENVCVRTSLIGSGGHQSPRPPPSAAAVPCN